MIKSAAAISRAVVLSWGREIASTFQTNPKKVAYGAVFILMLAIFFGSFLALISVSGLSIEIPAELKSLVLRTSIGSSVISTGIIATIACLTAPPSNSLYTLLELLPVSRISAYIGMRAPIILIALVFCLPMSTTSGLVIVRLASTWVDIALSIGILLIAIVITLLTTIGIYTTIHFALRRYLKLAYNYTTGVTGAVTIVITVASAIGDTLAIQPSLRNSFTLADLLLHRISANTIIGSSTAWGWLGLTGWSLIAIFVFAFSGQLYNQNLAEKPPLLFKGFRPKHNPTQGSLWFAFLLMARSPHFIVATTLPIPILTAIWLTREHPLLCEVSKTVALVLPSLPAYLAVYAAGKMLRLRWHGTILTASKSWWIFPTIAVHAVYSIAISTIIMLAEIALSFISLNDFPDLYSRVFLALATAFLGGALVPYSEEQPLSVTAAGLSTLVITMITALLISFCTSDAPTTVVSLLRLLADTILLGATFVTCKKLSVGTQHA